MTAKDKMEMNQELYPQPATWEAVQVESRYGTLYGTLDLPVDEEKCPVVLIIAGSGATDRDGNSEQISTPNDSLKMLGGWLNSLGCAVLRFDKRGVGESRGAGGVVSETLFSEMIYDAGLWFDLLKRDTRFSSVGVLGHSEGALVGLCTAGEKNADFYISIAGAGRPIIDVLREQLEAQPGFIRKKAKTMLDELEAGNTVPKVPFYLKSLFNPELQPYLMSWNSYNPAVIISGLKIPLLVIQGSTDLQTSLKDAEILAAAGGCDRPVIIEGMNHILKSAPSNRIKNLRTYAKAAVPLHSGLIEELDKFLGAI